VEEISEDGAIHTVRVDGKLVTVEVLKEIARDPLELLVRFENRIVRLAVQNSDESSIRVRLNERQFTASLELFEGLARASKREADEGPIVITAPMSGRIVSLKVGAGSGAEEGQSLVILEAMKMENEIASPRKGLVREIYVQPGALVKAGDKIALLE